MAKSKFSLARYKDKAMLELMAKDRPQDISGLGD